MEVPKEVRFQGQSFPIVSSRFSGNLWTGQMEDGTHLIAASTLVGQRGGKTARKTTYRHDGEALVFDYPGHVDRETGRIILDTGSEEECRKRAQEHRSGMMRSCSCGTEFHAEERVCPKCGKEPEHRDLTGKVVSREEEARAYGHDLDP